MSLVVVQVVQIDKIRILLSQIRVLLPTVKTPIMCIPRHQNDLTRICLLEKISPPAFKIPPRTYQLIVTVPSLHHSQ